jgi:predicted Ser/Thr protein kinase
MTDRSRPRLAQEAQSARLTAGIAAHGILPEMNDDRIIRQHIAGHSVSDIAKARRKVMSEVNEAIDRWADSTITDKTRKHTLALELGPTR